MTKLSEKKVTNEEIRKLVIARLRTLSGGKKISIGSDGEFSREELIKRVTDNDQVGKKIVQIQLEYLRSLKEGLFLPE
ncbi:MAG: hypothetical protein AAB580_04465 [Patescibacteria group bacterium]